jgi:integrase
MSTITKRIWTTRRGEQREAWVVRYADQEGKWRLKTFAKQKDAKDWQTTTLHQVKEGTHTPDSKSETLDQACAAWVNRGEAEKLEPSTITQRKQHVNLHILPLLGKDTKLSKLTMARVEELRDELLTTRSHELAKKVLTSLKGVLTTAKKRGMVAQNVALGVRITTNGRHRELFEPGRDIPTPVEAGQLLAAATGYMRPFMAVAIYCGLRMSELRGLRWQDVDFDKRVIRVRQRADLQGRIGPVKSAASRRVIPMSPTVINTLKEWRLACPRRGVKKDEAGNVIDPGELVLVFPNRKGGVQSHANIRNRMFDPLLTECGLTRPMIEDGQPMVDKDGKPVLEARYTPHGLRHFFASWLIDQGFNVKRVQTLMGHASSQITLDTYGHLFLQEDDHDKFAAGELKLLATQTA